MCTLHLRSQLLQRAELQLLHRSFAFPKLLRDLPNAPLLNETLEHYTPLLGGKFVDQSKQSRTTLDGLLFWAAAGLRRIFHIYRFARRALRKIGNSVRRNAVEPGRKRGARPCITFQVSKRLVRSEEHTSELQSRQYLVCRLLLGKKKDMAVDLARPRSNGAVSRNRFATRADHSAAGSRPRWYICEYSRVQRFDYTR